MIHRLLAAIALAAVAVGIVVACGGVPTVAPGTAAITLFANPDAIAIEGESFLTVSVLEATGQPVPDDTRVLFSTTLGQIEPASVGTRGGFAETRLFGGLEVGTATVTASSGAATPATIAIAIGAEAMSIVLVADPTDLPVGGGTSTLTATILDAESRPVPNVNVAFSTDRGTLASGGAPRTSAADGRAVDTLTTTVDATVTASVIGQSFRDDVLVDVAGTGAASITLVADPAEHDARGGTSSITATVLDRDGDPIGGIPVSFTTTAGSLSTLGTQLSSGAGLVSNSLTTERTATVTASSASATGSTTVEVGSSGPGTTLVSLAVSSELLTDPRVTPPSASVCDAVDPSVMACEMGCTATASQICCRLDIKLTATVTFDGAPDVGREVVFTADRASSQAASTVGAFCTFQPRATTDADGIAEIYYSVSYSELRSCQSIMTACPGRDCATAPSNPPLSTDNECCCAIQLSARVGSVTDSDVVELFHLQDDTMGGVKACGCTF